MEDILEEIKKYKKLKHKHIIRIYGFEIIDY